MNAKKYKHLSFKDRCTIEELLNRNYNFTQIGNHLKKDRTTISNEVKKHRFLRGNASPNRPCCFESKPPYVCNACKRLNSCKKQKYTYNYAVAYNEYKQTLINQRSNLYITKEQIANINDIISPLMIYKNHSVNQVYISHPDLLPFSKTTFYKYIDLGILNVRNINLQRKVRFKLKKEYDYYTRNRIEPSIKVNRFYSDFKDYLEFHPNASIVEMDTVIGTQGGKGGKCFLTLLFRQFNFMLIYLLPYKKSVYVTKIELVKSSVYIEDKLIVLLSNIKRKANLVLYMGTDQRNQYIPKISQSLKILYYFIRKITIILILIILKTF